MKRFFRWMLLGSVVALAACGGSGGSPTQPGPDGQVVQQQPGGSSWLPAFLGLGAGYLMGRSSNHGGTTYVSPPPSSPTVVNRTVVNKTVIVNNHPPAVPPRPPVVQTAPVVKPPAPTVTRSYSAPARTWSPSYSSSRGGRR